VILNDQVEIPPGMDKFKAEKVVNEKGVKIEYDTVNICVGTKHYTSRVSHVLFSLMNLSH